MNNLVPFLIEVAVLFGIYCLSSALTWSLLRRCEEEKGKAAGFLSCLGHLFAFISRRWQCSQSPRRRSGF